MNRRGLLGSLLALPFLEKVKLPWRSGWTMLTTTVIKDYRLVPFKFGQTEIYTVKTDDSVWLISWGDKTTEVDVPENFASLLDSDER